MTKQLLSMRDLDETALHEVLALAAHKAPDRALDGQGVALVFEHPSARTRNAAEMAIVQLGGHPVTIRNEEVGFDVRETVEDVARTLGSFHRVIGARVARHSTLVRMASALEGSGFDVPVVNLLSDLEHPTQILADLLTIEDCLGKLRGVRVAFIGDGNNVARSLAYGCALTGASFTIASPPGYSLADEDVALVQEFGGDVERHEAPEEAAEGADVLYADVWVSMGDTNADERRRALARYTIDERLVARASSDAIVLHCLPAHRGEEITADVLEGPSSRVWQQAENRMHALRGLLWYLVGNEP